jgi:hypothetical protein
VHDEVRPGAAASSPAVE